MTFEEYPNLINHLPGKWLPGFFWKPLNTYLANITAIVKALETKARLDSSEILVFTLLLIKKKFSNEKLLRLNSNNERATAPSIFKYQRHSCQYNTTLKIKKEI